MLSERLLDGVTVRISRKINDIKKNLFDFRYCRKRGTDTRRQIEKHVVFFCGKLMKIDDSNVKGA